jgi:uncharacterized protein (DUF302 family)
MADYGLKVTLNTPYAEVVDQVVAALKAQGFGVLTEIDVRATLKQKLDVDSRPYVILGACNPPLAHRAMQAEPDIGLLLPCNVIIYEGENAGQTVVAIIDPMILVQVVDNLALATVATEARARLERVAAALN